MVKVQMDTFEVEFYTKNNGEKTAKDFSERVKNNE